MTQGNTQSFRKNRFTPSELFVGGLCSAVIVASIALWALTGARMFTRFPDPELEQANAQDDLGDLFADTGLDDQHGEMEKVESEFTFGLLPAGPGKASLAVMSLVGPAIVFAPAFVLIRRRLAKKHTESSSRGNETSGSDVHQSAA